MPPKMAHPQPSRMRFADQRPSVNTVQDTSADNDDAKSEAPSFSGLANHWSSLRLLHSDGHTSPVRSPSPLQKSYQPGHVRTTSALDGIPVIPPPEIDSLNYMPPRSPTRVSAASRPWTPSQHGRDWIRPPASVVAYEPADINGIPRPGTPSSLYGGSPKRPLPPAPLFANSKPPSINFTAEDEPTLPIREDEDDMEKIDIDDDDVFGSPEKQSLRPTLHQADSQLSFMSESTFTEDLYAKSEHYGAAPEGAQSRRGARETHMEEKEVRLVNGELILECKIPTILYSFLPYKNATEFTHMRYTAVTCDPDEFCERGYKLRQQIAPTIRETELLICVTMYNENEIDFTRTMHAVMKNVAHFCSRAKSRTWGEDGWEKIVVCIVSDGRNAVHPRTLDALAAMGVYQSGIAKNLVNQKEVTAHVYEYTTQVSLDPDLKFKGREKGIMPCQLIFCLKEKNAKKLNSHRWFFNAVGKSLNPNVCILLDVGTKPGDNSLYHLWKAFDNDSNVAGAAGEIKAGKGKAWLGLLNPLVASQNFEYKMSNILDKPLESVFGYITVLPGALSAYRFHALQNDETGHGPLSQYFKGETLHGQDADVFTANMYLAEDRILCWELIAKRNERWVLKYVKNCTGETDVPDSLPEFISQRRRWLNGAFFAAVYSLLHWKQVWKTDHSVGRKILLHIEFFYQFISLLFTFFSLANFYLTFYFVAGSLRDPTVDPFGHNIGTYVFYVLNYSCILLICMQFIISMGNRPQGAKRLFMSSVVGYAIIMAYTTFAALYIVIRELVQSRTVQIGNNVFTNIVVSTLSTVGLYFIMSFLYADPWHMFTSSAQYFMMLPSYICTLQIYAFCNAHDVTWGTKGDNVSSTNLGAAVGGAKGTVKMDMPSEQLDIDSGYDEALRNLRDKIEPPPKKTSESQMQEDYYRAVRTYMVVAWMMSNAILAMSISEAYSGTHVSNNVYLKFILWSVAVLALFRAVGSGTYRMIQLIHWVAEGKNRWEMKMNENETQTRISGSSKWSMPSWGGSSGGSSWISSKLSTKL